jgi:hypothetical protein
MRVPKQWPTSTGRWNRTRTVIVTNHEDQHTIHARHASSDVVVVATPLDLIRELEDDHQLTLTVVLTGAYARNRDFTAFLLELYPMVRVVAGHTGVGAEPYLAAFD